mmetsp:Transcript_121894/g.351959  ORF Transcript_121894/g.351959 Transcript_121894/m.351959 type:complete len:294 (-) Transcript_121894:1215-2096(-)
MQVLQREGGARRVEAGMRLRAVELKAGINLEQIAPQHGFHQEVQLLVALEGRDEPHDERAFGHPHNPLLVEDHGVGSDIHQVALRQGFQRKSLSGPLARHELNLAEAAAPQDAHNIERVLAILDPVSSLRLPRSACCGGYQLKDASVEGQYLHLPTDRAHSGGPRLVVEQRALPEHLEVTRGRVAVQTLHLHTVLLNHHLSVSDNKEGVADVPLTDDLLTCNECGLDQGAGDQVRIRGVFQQRHLLHYSHELLQLRLQRRLHDGAQVLPPQRPQCRRCHRGNRGCAGHPKDES